MNTENTDKKKLAGWVLYDAECAFCSRLADWWAPRLAGRFRLLPLQAVAIRSRFGLTEAEWFGEMRLLTREGGHFGGADALVEIARRLWWARPLGLLARIPAAMQLLRAAYRWGARRRRCGNAACETRPEAATGRIRILDALPVLVLPVAAGFARGRLVSWAFMWLMALAIFAGCKWLTFRMATFPAREFGWQRKLGFWLAWPGMNAAEFLGERRAEKRPSPHEWMLAAGKIILGSALLWVGARLWLPAHPVGAGWTGMVGIIFILHFGLFQLLSLGWRRHGVVAAPMMQNPLAATSLAEFWGCRWNTAFHHLAFRFAFRPLRRVARPEMATLGVFGLSGLLHELVISLPAGAGYGGPTIYFLVQGAGVVVERTRWGRRFGLGRGVGGWIFTLLTTAVPVGLLFPPPFINNVIVPMLAAIGAT